MACRKLVWKVKKKLVYNVDLGKQEMMEFLRLNTINDYNNMMGGVDIANKLRGVYWLDWWICNRKWWWSIMFWAIGVLLTNSYIVYVNYNISIEKEKKKLLSHYNLLKNIAIA